MALHILACVETFKDQKMTSDFLAASINTNPVVVRRILSMLQKADIVKVSRGTGGVMLTRQPSAITFYDVYKAVAKLKDEGLFHRHEDTNPDCPVGRNINDVLNDKLTNVQKAMEDSLKHYTLTDVIEDLDCRLKGE